MEKYKKGELALRILFFISAGAAIPTILVAPNLAKVLIPALRKFAKKLDSRPVVVKNSLASLKERKFIRSEVKNGETIFVLTEAGKKRILRGKIDSIKLPIQEKWDGKWRLVLFDIPEKYKKAREALRLKFIDLGFYKFQKSCFIYPFECRDQIDFIKELFGVSRFVNYVVVESLEGEKNLKKIFNL